MPLDKKYFKPPKEFLIGVLSDLREDKGTYGPQVVVELTPLGELTPRLKWYNNEGGKAFNRRSGFQKFLNHFREMGMDLEEEELVGVITKIQIVAGHGMIEGVERDWDIWKPVKIYESESDALEDLAASDANVGGPPIPPMGPPTSSTLPADALAEAKKVWSADGMTEATFRMVAPTSYPGVDVDELVEAVKS